MSDNLCSLKNGYNFALETSRDRAVGSSSGS